MQTSMEKCKNCSTNFLIREEDKKFLSRISPVFKNQKYEMPHPTFCPDCRMQRRLSHRNERHLYKRICDFSKKNIISVYSPDKLLKVYDHEIWWSDKWDARSYGRSFDFNKTFFEQFHELQKEVPRMSMIISHCENSNYAPYSVASRNCYMCVSVVGSEDILYSYQANASQDCTDCSLCYGCELCYECIYCVKLYHSSYCVNCKDSSDLFLCRDCQNCDRCIGCTNLRNKKLHIFNKPVTEEEYQKYIQISSSYSLTQNIQQKFQDFSHQFPHRENYNINCDNITGDHLLNCKNAYHCFEAELLEDCAYIYTLPSGAKDCYDCHYTQKAELVYEAISGVQSYNCAFVLHSWNTKNSFYVDECFYSNYLFGCIGLKKNEYCILNKQYTKEEYENLVPRIIQHMGGDKAFSRRELEAEQGACLSGRSTERSEFKNQEWGNYFPTEISLFAYNESIANEFVPMTKEKILEKKWKWKEDTENTYVEQNYEIPDDIKNIKDEITSEILACTQCKKNFRIIAPELKFYQKMNLPIPRLCPNCRNAHRMEFRVQRKLLERNCSKCAKKIQTSYSKEKTKIILCEKCYLDQIV
ncbi:hypothetical protein HYV56_01440 [Candidatus Peregrinibacteria bacterium]|nr:hypothetical protein [Candidatus Peregrinibacteria bacterium]